MRRACTLAINPIGITHRIDEIALPGEEYHLLRDGSTERFVSPTGGEIGKANILLRACPQELIAVGVSCPSRPMGSDTLPIDDM